MEEPSDGGFVLGEKDGEDDEWVLKGKVVMVTGASSGIGLETCRMLLQEGCHVIMGCRNVMKAVEVKKELVMKASKCDVVEIDLSSLASIKKCSEHIIKVYSELHVLVNNAGVFSLKREVSQDGFELDFAVNHLGHFYLTRLLLPKLISSQPSRIITVSSEAHRINPVNLQDLQITRGWSFLSAYAKSKSANILFSSHLATLLQDTKVNTYSLHPGSVATHLGDQLMGSCSMRMFKCMMCCLCFRLLTPQQGAMTTLFCCKDQQLSLQSGLYYDKQKMKKAKSVSVDVMRGEELWRLSSELCGLNVKL